MTESVNTSTGRSTNITKPRIIKTGVNKNQNLLLKQSAIILWDFVIHTDRKIDANKAVIRIKDHKNNSFLLLEVMFHLENLERYQNKRAW